MKKKHFNITIAGAGGIGSAVALMLAELADFNCNIFIGDGSLQKAKDVADWVANGTTKRVKITPFEIASVKNSEDLVKAVKESDILLDCLPGSEAFRMGKVAYEQKKHYINLTEHVEATNSLIELAKNSKSAFVLQAGLAPGFINILAYSLFKEFCNIHKVEKAEYVGMKVGALSKNALAPHFYGFTWSVAGVATEYIKDAIIIKDYKKTAVSSLSENETIVIDGNFYECNYTSGGAADLPEILSGKVKSLNYKTLRYPGHFDWVLGILKNVPKGTDKIKYLETEMKKNIPTVEDDVIILHAAVRGFDRSNTLFQLEKFFKIKPKKIGKRMLRAIQLTTAAPMAECARMVLLGKYQGVILQSMINSNEFMKGPFIKKAYF